MAKKKFTRRGFLGRSGGLSLGVLASPAFPMQWLPKEKSLDASSFVFGDIAVGHEYRQDDMPSVVAAPDGTVWVTWLSYDGKRDDVAIRALRNNTWQNLQCVPGTSGDAWLPQVAVDASNRLWVVWSQQVGDNWDIYARRFEPTRQEWGPLERLTEDPLPDINPCVRCDGKGNIALVWQGFRWREETPSAVKSNIFLRTLNGESWSEVIRVTDRSANDWEPAVAIDGQGTVWVAYDSYKSGHYDVFLAKVQDGKVQGTELPVATGETFDARVSLAVDTQDRVWIAWESGAPQWGKDFGHILGKHQVGAPLGGFRELRIQCYQNGAWFEPEASLAEAFKESDTYQPHVFSDGKGSVWVVAKPRKFSTEPHRSALPQMLAYWEHSGPHPLGYWEYWATHLKGDQWSEPFALPSSKGRSSTRMNAALMADQHLCLTWPTDNRTGPYFHRPIRQQVYAGLLPAITSPIAPRLKPSTQDQGDRDISKRVEIDPTVTAIRAHHTIIDGQECQIVRGDFHRHTELSWDEGGRLDGSLLDFYRYMIDVAAMDFGANTEHQGGAWPYWWWFSQKMTDMHHLPQSYTSFFAYERSASFPFGHRNVFFSERAQARMIPYFLKEGVEYYSLPLTSEGSEPADECLQLVGNDTTLLYDEVRARHGIAIPHTTATGMGTDWGRHVPDPDVEPVVELFQGCRNSYEQAGAPYCVTEEQVRNVAPMLEQMRKNWPNNLDRIEPGGFVSNAWQKGYKLGVIASSDHFSTHISYALVYTHDRTRRGILEAMRKRHTYGATDNIILEVWIGRHFMGDLFACSMPFPPLVIKALGTDEIARIDVIKDSKVLHTAEPHQHVVNLEFKDLAADENAHYYYVRLQQVDGMIAWSSPLFVNYQ